jgi:hypothetical protein
VSQVEDQLRPCLLPGSPASPPPLPRAIPNGRNTEHGGYSHKHQMPRGGHLTTHAFRHTYRFGDAVKAPAVRQK